MLLKVGLVLVAAGLGGATTSGCGDDTSSAATSTPPPVCSGFLGDPTRAPELELTTLRAFGDEVPLDEGGRIVLLTPPQGGRVVFVGVRATNLGACGLRLQGVVRDLENQKIQIDTRTVNLVPGDDGWGTSVAGEISTFANVPLCPNGWATTDVFDEPFQLSVSLRDGEGREAKRTIGVVPDCDTADLPEVCRCLCDVDYASTTVCEESPPDR